MRDTQIAQWLEEMKTKTNISSEFGPTPTPFAEAFDPPANAPPPPTPTPIPSAPRVAGRVAGRLTRRLSRCKSGRRRQFRL